MTWMADTEPAREFPPSTWLPRSATSLGFHVLRTCTGRNWPSETAQSIAARKHPGPILSPRISVITATRNAAATLPALYDSLCAQDYPDFEWVVADGCSTDGTVGLLQRLAARSAWVRFVSESDAG